MAVKKRVRKRIKKSGVIYFASNSRIDNMVKIGMTVDTAEARLNTANRKHEFMPGLWSISQKVKIELFYKKNQSIILDIKILYLTFLKVIKMKDIKH